MDNTTLNGYRKWAIDHDENVYWCKPYVSSDGRTKYILTDGKISELIVDGKSTAIDDVTIDEIDALARLHNPYYNDESTPAENLMGNGEFTERSCAACPWFRKCENWDNPDGWEEYHPDYPDDPGYDD